MASSYAIPLFKTDSVNDLSFEQFRVLVAFLSKLKDELAQIPAAGLDSGTKGHKEERTTIRITNED